MISAGPAFTIERPESVGEFLEGRRVVEAALDETQALRQSLPDILPERCAGMVAHGIVDDLAEVLVRPIPAGEPDESEPGRQKTTIGRS